MVVEEFQQGADRNRRPQEAWTLELLSCYWLKQVARPTQIQEVGRYPSVFGGRSLQNIVALPATYHLPCTGDTCGQSSLTKSVFLFYCLQFCPPTLGHLFALFSPSCLSSSIWAPTPTQWEEMVAFSVSIQFATLNIHGRSMKTHISLTCPL